MTHLDQIIDYPFEVIKQITKSQAVVDLLADKPFASIEDIEDDEGNLRYIFDFEYVPETVVDAKTYICVDTVVKAENSTINDISLFIHVICHKSAMQLDHTRFLERKGNRRDNLVREIDAALRDSDDFGIGKLQLTEVSPFTLPVDFTGKTIAYTIPSYSKRRYAL